MARRLCEYCEQPLNIFAKLLRIFACKECAFRLSCGALPRLPRERHQDGK